jgi:hypothetical protein
MPQAPERQLPPIEFKRWGGIVTNANPHQMPAGSATEILNLNLALNGTLAVRTAVRELSFEN